MVGKGSATSLAARTIWIVRSFVSRRDESERLLDVARTGAIEAGAVARKRQRSYGEARAKASPADIATDADVAAERAARAAIRSERPDDAILGEEEGEEAGTSGLCWIVDAIDGTANYVAGLPTWAVSIALQEIEPEATLVAVVHQPLPGRTFTAVRGRGAWCDGKPLPLVERIDKSLADSLVATGFAPGVSQRAEQAGQLARVLPHVRDVRCHGAASLELCAVAAGELDGYFESGLQPWDLAAGALIAAEAGADVRIDAAGSLPLIAAWRSIAGELTGLLAV